MAGSLVILDTNVCMAVFQWRIDVLAELDRALGGSFEVAILDRTIQELSLLTAKAKSGRDRECARLAQDFIKRKALNIITSFPGPDTDDVLLEKASRGTLVATQDQVLKRRILAAGGSVITIRQKRHLAIER
ncbi:hypothetical protein JXB02_00570 [Candidatus Woesearchaeota archaeon]|nr:hypothetical protein [Candidatus Woesearchaeota archaeon]